MYGKKKVSKPNKIISEKRIDVFFNIIEWSIFFGFCVVAAIFVKDVWNQFQSKETFMGQSLAPIKKLPTIVFCFDTPFSWWIYHPGYFEIKLAGLSTAFLTLKENETVHFEETNESYDFTLFWLLRNFSVKSKQNQQLLHENYSVKMLLLRKTNSSKSFQATCYICLLSKIL